MNFYFKVDVTDKKALRKLGFKKSKYFCGLNRHQKIISKLAKKAKEFGIELPFNEACFKHDLMYGQIFLVSKFNLPKKLYYKFLADYIFLRDMRKLIDLGRYDSYSKKLLKRWALVYYLTVTFGTVFYLIYVGYDKLKNIFKNG